MADQQSLSVPELRRELGLRDMVLFNVAVVAGVRGFSGAAQAGSIALPLFVLCIALFFVPMAIVVASLGRRFPEEGGFYVWIREAFGERTAFLCAWAYSIAMLVYFPVLLIFGASVLPHVLGRQYAPLADRAGFVLPATFVMLWAVTLANIAGLRFAKWINNAGGIGTYAAFAVILAAGLVAVRTGGPATHTDWMVPWKADTVFAWSQIWFFLTGLELGGIMAGEIRRPQRTLVTATATSAAAIAVFYVTGTGALLAMLPAGAIDPVYGTVQAVARAGSLLGADWLPIALAAIITVSVVGAFGANLCSTSRLPWVFGVHHYLPSWFGRVHPRFGTPYAAMLAGAVGSSCFLVAMFSGESLRSGYNTLYDSTILLTVLPLAVMFAAAWKLGQRLSAGLGLAVTATVLICSVVPPPDTTALMFEAKAFGLLAAASASGWWLYHRAHAQRRRIADVPAAEIRSAAAVE
jgi:amino acid transporter